MRFTEIKSLPGTWLYNYIVNSQIYIIKAEKVAGIKGEVMLAYITVLEADKFKERGDGLKVEYREDWPLRYLPKRTKKKYREVIKLTFKETIYSI